MKPSDILPDGPHYDLKRHLAHVKHLWKKYPYRGPHACAERAADLVVEAGYQTPFGEELAAMVARLLDDDIFITHEPTLEYAPYLTRMQKRLTLRYDDAFLAIKEFLRELQPLIPTEPGLATIPLHTIFQPHTFIGTVYRCFHDVTSDGEYLFDDLRRQLYRNLITASGYDPGTYDGKRKLVVPAESRDAPEDVYRKYLANTPFLDILDFPVPFAIPIDSYREHGFLFAKSGHGKSQSMRAMLSSLLDQDCALFVIDGNGALIENLDRVESIKDRLVVLDPTETPALNFFKMQGASREKQMELFFYLFSAIDQSLTERQATMVAYLVDLMQAIPDATFDTLPPGLRGEDVPLRRRAEAAATDHPRLLRPPIHGQRSVGTPDEEPDRTAALHGRSQPRVHGDVQRARQSLQRLRVHAAEEGGHRRHQP